MQSLARAKDRRNIQERILAIQASDQARWGTMTADEMLCHLRGAFEMAMGTIRVDQQALSVPRTMLKAVPLWMPLRWVKNYGTVPALKRGAPAMRSVGFAADRAGALQAMHRFCQSEQVGPEHPFFGPMSTREWMRWGFSHTDHHLRQFGR